ncbi:TIGR03668 family PPOX class F420-dependent oxidoreductase [Isoptericola croceus]|uniref:TIGR03668 family PPOX class F420-dependent oxidoreductase n=1 Tax=Isoptericola croceus TaxID=3031406 RepID=UPI0023F6C60B|nr:TIGR03668 family PPOX class F420-dependent oxidoreductase [Isoptericola croceus]
MPRLDETECRRRFATARHAYLATADADGVPHVVPVTFAVLDTPDGTQVVSAVDHKPKTTTDLRRLRNVAANPRAALLVDAYDDDWSRLWWVRVDGVARVEVSGAARDVALGALEARYEPYRRRPPRGPLLRLSAERWAGWTAVQSG